MTPDRIREGALTPTETPANPPAPTTLVPLCGDSDAPVQSIPDDGVHRRPDDWKVLAARGAAASLIPTAPQRWNEPEGPDRVSPRECIRNAQEELNKAWGTADYAEAVHWIRGGVDWLRRALEQMT